MAAKVLICDISKGENVVMAMATPGGRPASFRQYSVNSYADFESALQQYWDAQEAPDLMAAAFSAPGWESDGIFEMPNHGYKIERSHIRALLNVKRLHMVNSGMAKALAIPNLREDEREKVCGGDGDETQVKGLVGASIGLGMAAIVPDDFGKWTAFPGEGGHSDLASITRREFDVAELIARKYGRASRERAVSLPGLAEIWRCLNVLDGIDAPEKLSPDQVVALTKAGDARAREAVNLCTGWLASMTADAALMLGARGGMYLSGQLVHLMNDVLDYKLFEDRYYDKGRLRPYMQDIPVYKITANEPEILGLSTLFE
jgi:glucokinase